MTVKLANNATSRLAASISSSDTTIILLTGEGSRFPSTTGGDTFPVTLVKATGQVEICRCTTRTLDTLTVTRGQEGTSAQSFSAGDRVELRMTNGAFEERLGEKLQVYSSAPTTNVGDIYVTGIGPMKWGGSAYVASLGTAAAKDVTASATDTTAGRALKVGDWGVGGPAIVVDGNDLFADDNFTAFYGINLVNVPANPGLTSGWVLKMSRAGGYRRVIFRPWTGSALRIFENAYNPTTSTWLGWVEQYHSGNLPSVAASEASAGVIKIATSALAQALTDDTTTITPKKLGDALNANVFGANQAWQDVTASRANNVTYTNSTGKPIMVSLSVGGGNVPNIDIYVDAIRVFMSRNAFSSTTEVGCVGIIPAGSTYKAVITGTLTYWKELR